MPGLWTSSPEETQGQGQTPAGICGGAHRGQPAGEAHLSLSVSVFIEALSLPQGLSWERTRPPCRRPGFDPRVGKISGKGHGNPLQYSWAPLVAQMVKNLLQCRRPGFSPWVGKIPWRRAWQPTPVFLPRESPWTEESGRLQTMGSQKSWTRLSD